MPPWVSVTKMFFNLLPLVCLNTSDCSLQVGPASAVKIAVTRSKGRVAFQQQKFDVPSRPRFIVWKGPDAFVDCNTVHTVLNRKQDSGCVVVYVLLCK